VGEARRETLKCARVTNFTEPFAVRSDVHGLGTEIAISLS